MTTRPSSDIRHRLALGVTPELYQHIKRLWIKHSIAEDRRDLQGLVDTLSDDCVYEITVTGQRWHGHAGARAFYTSFLGAFPDVHFDLTDIVIGPQGVIEVADLSGTHQGTWGEYAPSGKPVRLPIIIHFPWDTAAGLFAGEKIWYDRKAMEEQILTSG